MRFRWWLVTGTLLGAILGVFFGPAITGNSAAEPNLADYSYPLRGALLGLLVGIARDLTDKRPG